MSRRVVGIVGAGQLARMTLAAATALDVEVRVLAVDPDQSAARVWPAVDVGRPDDAQALHRFADRCDVLTFDHELVPPPLVTELARDHVVRPGPGALLAAQDKGHQRDRFTALGLPIPRFVVGDRDAIRAFGDRAGWPIVVKAPTGGYDGRGVDVARDAADLGRAWEAVGGRSAVLAEERLRLDREIAVVMARRPSGDVATWAAVDTVQREGILTELAAPAGVDPDVAARATGIAGRIAEELDVVGTMAVEFFVAGGEILVNEIALRPHNSGHWTIEGARTSQFEQHLRAVLDWPLGDTAATAPAVATVNVLGPADGSDPGDRLAAALGVPGAHVHLYGKSPRPGRKLGHVTVCADDRTTAGRLAARAAAILEGTS